MRINLNLILLFIICLGIFSCSGQLQDPSTLVDEQTIGEFFESWDPDTVSAPGAQLITFTGGDTETTFPYYARNKSYPIKFKVNSGGMPSGVVDPGIYSVKIEYSSNNGSTWTTIPSASNIPVSAGLVTTFNWLIPIGLAEGTQYLLRLTASAVSGDTSVSISTQNFIIDATAPTITSLSLTLGSTGVADASTVNRSFFGFSITATESLTPIKFYCMKTDGSVIPPLANDDCWQDFGSNSGLSLNLTNLPGYIGFVAGAYDLRIWLQDSASNISSLTSGSGSSGVDLLSIAYNPSVAAEITNVLISNNDSASLSPASSNLLFTAGQTVYVRWKVIDSDLVSTPISISYTTDESTFLAVSSLQNITNANQGGCTIDGNYTGCATFIAPSSGYFRVQISAIDQTGLISKGGSVAANMNQFSILVGNTDVGLNGSANKAIFLNKTKDDASTPQTGIIAVSKRGKVFYLDQTRGILVVDPQDGAQKIYIPASTSSTGDGGHYSNATTANTLKISLDYQDRLLIFENDGIRRVEASGTIQKIIGGGSLPYNNSTKAAINASEFKMAIAIAGTDPASHYLLFQPLPDGNIWFSLNARGLYNEDNGILFGIYKAVDQKVYFLGLKGTGVRGDPTFKLNDGTTSVYTTPALSFDYRTSKPKYLTLYFCRPVPGGCGFYSVNFNPRTGQSVAYGTHYPMVSYWGANGYISSRRGDLYNVSRAHPTALFKLNTSSVSWDKVMGNSDLTVGFCADDTQATSCGIDIADAFISENKTIYFVDRGGIIRVILPNGKVKTLFGQNLSFGNGGLPSSARLGRVNWMGVWGPDNTVVVYDESEMFIREFTQGTSATSYNLCGNGRTGSLAFNSSSPSISIDPAENNSCFGGYWGSSSLGMSVDRRNGEVYTSLSGRVSKIARSGPNAGRWQSLVGSGSTYCYQNAESDNQLGSSVGSCSRTTGGGGYPISVIGLLEPDIATTSSSLGAVENGTDSAYVMMSSQIWNGSRLIENFYKVARGSDGLLRHISGASGADANYSGGLPGVGVNFTTSTIQPIYESYNESVYVQEDRSVLFGEFGGTIIQTPLTRTGGDLITGAGIISKRFSFPNGALSFNYKWSTGRMTDIFYCNNQGVLNRYNITSGISQVCPFPKNSLDKDMFTCFGRSMHWDSTKTKLIFPIKQNGMMAIGQYDISGCL